MAESIQPKSHESNNKPIPDPTLLTTQQLLREMSTLKEIIFTRLEGMDRALVLFSEATNKEITYLKELRDTKFAEFDIKIEATTGMLSTRLNGMDKAIILLQNIHDTIPVKIDVQVNALKLLHEEKFSSIQTQFRERDVRTEQSSKDSKVAVATALQAAKEAVGEQNKSSAAAINKSESSTVKQIDQLGLLIQQVTKAVDDKFSDVKERLTRIEGKGEGVVVSETGHRSNTMTIIAVISTVIALAAVVVAAVGAFLTFHK